MSISFMTSFGKRPMHFFGLLGTLSFIVGFGISVYLTILKIAFNVSKMTDRAYILFRFIMYDCGYTVIYYWIYWRDDI